MKIENYNTVSPKITRNYILTFALNGTFFNDDASVIKHLDTPTIGDATDLGDHDISLHLTDWSLNKLF